MIRVLLIVVMVFGPVMGAGANGTEPAVLPHLDVKLKAGWRYHTPSGVFRSPSGETFAAAKDLPKGAKIAATVPALAEADPQSLSESELNLAHYVQIIFAKRSKPEQFLERIGKWPCVETVKPTPKISLP